VVKTFEGTDVLPPPSMHPRTPKTTREKRRYKDARSRLRFGQKVLSKFSARVKSKYIIWTMRCMDKYRFL